MAKIRQSVDANSPIQTVKYKTVWKSMKKTKKLIRFETVRKQSQVIVFITADRPIIFLC